MDKLKEPPINLSEYDGDLVLAAPMPGTEPEEIRITITDGNKVVLESRARGDRAEAAKWYIHDWTVGEHIRTVSLPYSIDADRTNATYKNGVLTLSMPRGMTRGSRVLELKPVASAHGELVGHRGRASTM